MNEIYKGIKNFRGSLSYRYRYINYVRCYTSTYCIYIYMYEYTPVKCTGKCLIMFENIYHFNATTIQWYPNKIAQ